MSRFIIEKGRKVTEVIVGVNQNGKYHHKTCRFYSSSEFDMAEKKAISEGYICGSCCAQKK